VKNYFQSMNREKILEMLFQIMILSSFWGAVLLPITVPGIGEIFLFRVALLLFFCFYLYDIIKKKQNPLKGCTKIEKIVFILVAIIVLYGIISLVRSIDFIFTFKKLFNLCFDLLFLISIILYINNRRKVNITMFNCLINVLLLQFMGIYEIFMGGIFSTHNNIYQRFPFFDLRLLQPPIVSFVNENDYTSTLLFCVPFLVMFLLYHYQNTNKKEYKFLLLSILVFIISSSYFIVKVSSSRLVMLAFSFTLIGIVLFSILFQRKLFKMVLICFLCITFVFLMENYTVIRVKTINYINTVKYEIELRNNDKDEVKKPVILEIPTLPSKNNVSIIDQFIQVDENTNEVTVNSDTSAGVRVKLMMFAMKTFLDSKGLGVGLGNTEQLAKVVADEQLGGLWSLHCFPIRLIADMGIFILFPVTILMLMILKNFFSIISKYYKKGLRNKSIIVFTIISILCFPFLVTSSSDAQDLLGMWLYIAGIIIIMKSPELFFINEIV